jgi:hypothetical protein
MPDGHRLPVQMARPPCRGHLAGIARRDSDFDALVYAARVSCSSGLESTVDPRQVHVLSQCFWRHLRN